MERTICPNWPRRWALPLAFLALTFCVQPSYAAPAKAIAEAQRLAGEGKAAYLAKDYDKAADLYAEALRNFEHENLFFTYARCLEQLGQFKTAAYAFDRAVTMMKDGPESRTMAARGAANRQLDEAQQLLVDGQAAAAQPRARAAHAVMIGQSKRAEDGEVYPEPAEVLLLLARIELALGNRGGAQQILVEIKADPTAPDKVVQRAVQLAGGEGAVPARVEPAKVEPAKPEPVKVVPVKVVPVKPEPAEIKAPKADPGPASTPPVAQVASPGPGPQRPMAAWIALGSSAAVAVAGAVWWGLSAAEVGTIQGKLDAARSSGAPVDGLSLADYEAAKTRLDRGYLAGSAMTIGGGVGMAASAVWLWLGTKDGAATRAAVVPQAGGAAMVVRW